MVVINRCRSWNYFSKKLIVEKIGKKLKTVLTEDLTINLSYNLQPWL